MKEKESAINKILPVGYSSSELAFKEFFGINAARSGNNPLQREVEILKKHYYQTFLFTGFIKQITSNNLSERRGNLTLAGMGFFNYAARIEGKTKKLFIPQVSEAQLNKYMIDSEVINFEGEKASITDSYINRVNEQFDKLEPNMKRGLDRLRFTPGNFDIKSGCAMMSDFLRTAPDLS